MIIISQNGLYVTKNMELGISKEYTDDYNRVIRGYSIENDSITLGLYETEERAKEVLMEIVNADIKNILKYKMPEK